MDCVRFLLHRLHQFAKAAPRKARIGVLWSALCKNAFCCRLSHRIADTAAINAVCICTCAWSDPTVSKCVSQLRRRALTNKVSLGLLLEQWIAAARQVLDPASALSLDCILVFNGSQVIRELVRWFKHSMFVLLSRSHHHPQLILSEDAFLEERDRVLQKRLQNRLHFVSRGTHC